MSLVALGGLFMSLSVEKTPQEELAKRIAQILVWQTDGFIDELNPINEEE